MCEYLNASATTNEVSTTEVSTTLISLTPKSANFEAKISAAF